MKLSPLLIIFICFPYLAFSQSVVDTVRGDDSDLIDSPSAPILNEEQITKIAPSKRVLILSNKNNSYSKGDFISLVLDNKLVNRAVVAKISNGLSGIKIVKIYSSSLNARLRAGSKVQVIRGDDSYFRLKKEAPNKEGEFKIKSEDDLFNEDVVIDEKIDLEKDEGKRAIKTDNVISAYLGLIESVDLDNNTKRYNQLSASWAYQVDDNIWAEVSYGENLIKDYPAIGIDTKMTNFTIKGKYTIKAPFFSYLKPYVGFQVISADAPGAEEKEEFDLVDKLPKDQIVFGVTILKRLVPGWFARVDLGTDILSFGFALEF